ncbi:hypothetical protein [Sulfitobacter sp. R18_1]|uniref:hypothetical protein n=1 Tax=Sulfitobacter sp. R18_1 TaxID=2821104 RepID=UPI001ADA5990|nr:hypothetical protein [Sulfitobacter sp. R18_1]MBO9428021.1 hypothetical protein [Sulfitobacter sp. R18_1]
MTEPLKSATHFMRDNTNGGLVAKAVLRKDGSIRYKMKEGHSYLLNEEQQAVLSRYSFEPRFEKPEA